MMLNAREMNYWKQLKIKKCNEKNGKKNWKENWWLKNASKKPVCIIYKKKKRKKKKKKKKKRKKEKEKRKK